jgi:hypothetical protein
LGCPRACRMLQQGIPERSTIQRTPVGEVDGNAIPNPEISPRPLVTPAPRFWDCGMFSLAFPDYPQIMAGSCRSREVLRERPGSHTSTKQDKGTPFQTGRGTCQGRPASPREVKGDRGHESTEVKGFLGRLLPLTSPVHSTPNLPAKRGVPPLLLFAGAFRAPTTQCGPDASRSLLRWRRQGRRNRFFDPHSRPGPNHQQIAHKIVHPSGEVVP